MCNAHGLEVKNRRRFVHTTDSDHTFPVAKNLLNRQFVPEAPNQVWMSDITYLWSANHWLYLCTIIDGYSSRVVGRTLSRAIDADLVCDALAMALRNRGPVPGCVFHSDRGSQYASDRFVKMLKENGFRQSMSRRANCWDNAVAESSFARLKVELGDQFASDAEAVRAVYEYCDVFHNHIRIHSRLNQSPASYEAAI